VIDVAAIRLAAAFPPEAPLTVRSLPASSSIEEPVEVMVTPASTVRLSSSCGAVPAFLMIGPLAKMSVLISSGLEVWMLTDPCGANIANFDAVTPPAIRPPLFHSQISPLVAMASILPTVLTMRPVNTPRRLPEPTLPEAMKSAMPALTMAFSSGRPFRMLPPNAVMKATASAPGLMLISETSPAVWTM
jgi:hypothetical protein